MTEDEQPWPNRATLQVGDEVSVEFLARCDEDGVTLVFSPIGKDGKPLVGRDLWPDLVRWHHDDLGRLLAMQMEKPEFAEAYTAAEKRRNETEAKIRAELVEALDKIAKLTGMVDRAQDAAISLVQQRDQLRAENALLLELWRAVLDSTSVEPTEEQIAAGYVELLDKDSAHRISNALDALEPFESLLAKE